MMAICISKRTKSTVSDLRLWLCACSRRNCSRQAPRTSYNDSRRRSGSRACRNVVLFSQVATMFVPSLSWQMFGCWCRMAASQDRKRHFLRHLYIKCMILPRQARDKHRENRKRKTENVFRRTHPCPRMAPATSCHSVHQTATHTTHPGPSVYPSCPCTPHRCRRRQWHSLRAWHRTAQAPARRSDGEAPMTRTALVLSSESH